MLITAAVVGALIAQLTLNVKLRLVSFQGALNFLRFVEETWQRTPLVPQWGAADAEIKVPSGENTELKSSPFQAWSRSV